MRSLFFVVALSALFVADFGYAREMNGVTLEDQIQLDKKNLLLNGMGLRIKKKFAIPIKVYVGGLYLEKKASDADAIVKSPEAKRVVMQMLLPVDRDLMVEAFETGYMDNCVHSCETKKEQFGKFKVHVPSVRKGDRLVFTYKPDGVDFEVIGANAKKATLPGVEMSQNLMALFIGKVPPTPEFKNGLLGL